MAAWYTVISQILLRPKLKNFVKTNLCVTGLQSTIVRKATRMCRYETYAAVGYVYCDVISRMTI